MTHDSTHTFNMSKKVQNILQTIEWQDDDSTTLPRDTKM